MLQRRPRYRSVTGQRRWHESCWRFGWYARGLRWGLSTVPIWSLVVRIICVVICGRIVAARPAQLLISALAICHPLARGMALQGHWAMPMCVQAGAARRHADVGACRERGGGRPPLPPRAHAKTRHTHWPNHPTTQHGQAGLAQSLCQRRHAPPRRRCSVDVAKHGRERALHAHT